MATNTRTYHQPAYCIQHTDLCILSQASVPHRLLSLSLASTTNCSSAIATPKFKLIGPLNRSTSLLVLGPILSSQTLEHVRLALQLLEVESRLELTRRCWVMLWPSRRSCFGGRLLPADLDCRHATKFQLGWL